MSWIEVEPETGDDSADAIASNKENKSAMFGASAVLIVPSIVVDETESPEDFVKEFSWTKVSGDTREGWLDAEISVAVTVRDAFANSV